MDNFNIKYEELSLTGNIPKHPHYLYEYDIPRDLGKIGGLIPYYDNSDTSYLTYTNNQGKKVIATNICPCVLMYKPKDKEECQEQ